MFRFTTLLLSAAAIAVGIPTGGFYNGQVNTGPGTLCTLDNGVHVVFQNDGNLVVYNGNNAAIWSTTKVAPNGNCNGLCRLNYQGDGNLVTYYNNQPLFNAGTGGGQGAFFLCTEAPPYLMVLDVHGNIIWSTHAP